MLKIYGIQVGSIKIDRMQFQDWMENFREIRNFIRSIKKMYIYMIHRSSIILEGISNDRGMGEKKFLSSIPKVHFIDDNKDTLSSIKTTQRGRSSFQRGSVNISFSPLIPMDPVPANGPPR